MAWGEGVLDCTIHTNARVCLRARIKNERVHPAVDFSLTPDKFFVLSISRWAPQASPTLDPQKT